MKRENGVFKKSYLVILLFVALIVGITFGYAALQTTLTINGTTTIGKTSWDVRFETPITVNESSYMGDQTHKNTVVLSDNDTTCTYTVYLAEPGDFFEFTVNAKNYGTLQAVLESIVGADPTIAETAGDTEYTGRITDYLEYTVTGLPAVNDVLKPAGQTGDSIPIKIRVAYKTNLDADDLPKDGDPTVFKRTIKLNYKQDK